MPIQAHSDRLENPYDRAREKFDGLVDNLRSPETMDMTHSEVENLIDEEGREILRRLPEGHLRSRSPGEAENEVRNAEGTLLTLTRDGREAREMSLFGPVRFERTAYSVKGEPQLFPLDGKLNLPVDSYTFGVRKRVVREASRNSFNETVAAIEETTGANVSKRQARELVERAAVDFDGFYQERETSARNEQEAGSVLVITVDGKGVPMLKKDLREPTKAAAEQRKHKLHSKLSSGEKKNTKRMSTVAAVYTIDTFCRTPDDVVAELRRIRKVDKKRPLPEHKRVWASVVKEPAEVIEEAFEEACRRDPEKKRHWVAVVDGADAQIKALEACAKSYGVQLTIVLDIIHVLGYLWKASHAFHKAGTSESEQWVSEKLQALLEKSPGHVAAGIGRRATLRGIKGKKREAVDKCCNYILKRTAYMQYATYLDVGFPIASGVVEGACKHLVKDRMEISGALWGLLGADSVLKLRALHVSGDAEQYWSYHERQEYLRNHAGKYADGVPKTRTHHEIHAESRANLRLVK
jgi:hypothetical protein